MEEYKELEIEVVEFDMDDCVATSRCGGYIPGCTKDYPILDAPDA